MKPANKELIEGIAELFDGYEEEYVPGEWEAFSQAGKARRQLFPMWMRIAAILFIIISGLSYGLSDLLQQRKNQKLAGRTPAHAPAHTPVTVPDSAANLSLAQSKSQNPGIIQNQNTSTSTGRGNPGSGIIPAESTIVGQILPGTPVLVHNSKGNHNNYNIVSSNNSGQSNNNTYNNSTNNSTSAADQQLTAVIAESVPGDIMPGQYVQSGGKPVAIAMDVHKDTAVLLKKQNTIDFLLSEAKSSQLAAHTVKKEKSAKWGFGVEIMPTVMKSNLNVGAGLTTDYRLSDKFSVSSGISILQLKAGAAVGQNPNAKSSLKALSSRQLTATDANLSAIDIPVGLVYHVNKNFYASAGVSYFNVIRDRRSNTYETTAEFYTSGVDASTGNTALYQAVKSESVAEPAQESPLKGNSYLGFFNFSLGREQHLSGRYTIIIEPFVKIPVGKLSDQELKLMNSGLKFKLAF